MRTRLSVVLVAALLGCSGDGSAPPLADLPLRDALSATPEAIAQLPDADRRALAERLESARKAPQADEAADKPTSAVDEVRTIDDRRRARGVDALIVAFDRDAALHVHLQDPPSDPPTLPPLEGSVAAETADAEARAIEGRAGAILLDLSRVTGAHHLVRVTQWPVGAVSVGDTIYVNAAWLVALAAMETGSGPALQPAAIRGTPYRTYDTLAACTNDVGTRCGTCVASGVDCDEKATLGDFANGRAECEWLVADQQRIPQLCALALMSISSIARCVSESSGCSIPSGTSNNTSSLSATATFLTNTSCIRALNVCLSGSTSTAISPDGGTTSESAPRSSEGCQDPFSACASSLKGCNDACKTGSCSGKQNDSCSGSNCSSCNQKGDSCSGCKSSSSTGSSSSSSSSNCNKCETGRSPLEPFLPPAMLAAPLLYLLVRARRAR